MENITPWILIFSMLGVGFYAGYGWGKFNTEREIREIRENYENGKIFVSVPADKEMAGDLLELIGALIKKIESEQLISNKQNQDEEEQSTQGNIP